MKVLKRQGQWLGDVVIRETGDIHRIVETAIINGVSITGYIPTGTEVLLPDVQRNSVADYYTAKSIYPATSTEQEASDGIGYMAVGSTFIVS
jgi:hypothetical protein